MSTPALSPILYDTSLLDNGSYPLPPFPMKGQILIEISAFDSNTITDLEWSGNVLYGDGDITSFEGNGDVAIVVDCATGQPYSVTFQKDCDFGNFL